MGASATPEPAAAVIVQPPAPEPIVIQAAPPESPPAPIDPTAVEIGRQLEETRQLAATLSERIETAAAGSVASLQRDLSNVMARVDALAGRLEALEGDELEDLATEAATPVVPDIPAPPAGEPIPTAPRSLLSRMLF